MTKRKPSKMCKTFHANIRHLVAHDRLKRGAWCRFCGDHVTIGKSDDRGTAVRIEIAAARLVAAQISNFDTEDDERNPLFRAVLDWRAEDGPSDVLHQVDTIYCDATTDLSTEIVT